MNKDAFHLERIDGQLSLVIDASPFKPLSIDFLAGKTQHRREYGGGHGQLIAKAIGIKRIKNPSILDLTAGFGQDAFVLACLGCEVTMLERAPAMAALLEDALLRLDDASLKLTLLHTDAQSYLHQVTQKPDVIYFDPMYPDSKNTAQPKKEMQVLRELVGEDEDSATIFELALQKAGRRVVVKRPRHGDRINAREPDVVFEGKSSRFDVYLP
ncbi:MAG: hypothetical protein COB66_01625 [Coxiella sp. (in: Bacteria)]|nr:MAG: hypothetical protein COB66_01625 [Coxiella sp. (in: g-proteobacteria)]